MKHILVTICLVIFMISSQSCRKTEGETSNSVIGTWELRITSAAMMPSATNHPEGNGNILKFTDSTYEKYQNGQLIKSGVYAILPDTTVGESTCMVFDKEIFTNRLVFDNNFNSTKVFIDIAGNRLSFISGCYALDAGYTEVYERISNND